MKIVPAIIPDSFQDLEEHIRDVKSFTDFVQIDVLDGVHVPEKSWPYINQNDSDFENIRSVDGNLPFWEDVQFEIDLMLKKPEDVWRDWIDAGASRIIVHIESTDKLGKIIEDFKEDNVSGGSFLRSQIGLAIQIDTNNETLYPHLEDIDFVQCMGIKDIGYQGQEFDSRVLDKIKDFKNRKPDLVVVVDGGMNEGTIRLVSDAGADRVAVGSALFESEDIEETFYKLSKI